jgi:IS605 OrfB family transposase
MLTKESDCLKTKYIRRNKIKGVVDGLRKKGSQAKADRIVGNNLGRKKLDARINTTHKNVRTVVFNAVHKVVDKACHVVCEDLTMAMAGKKFGKNVNRRLSSWTKGVIAEALENVSQRRGSTLHYVNPAYTSQMDSKTHLLSGKRVGDKFYRENGEVLQADVNAARNVLARLYDPEIDRWTPYKKVKSILLKRTESQRLGLLNPDSSCSVKTLSTESELPNVQLCLIF